MSLARKLGRVPAAPLTRPPLQIKRYKQSDEANDDAFRIAALSGCITVLTIRRAARRQFSRVVCPYLTKKLYQFGFAEDYVLRLDRAIGEMLPNAFQHAPIDTRVSITVIILGVAPQRHTILLVSNFLGSPVHFPEAGQLPRFEDILLAERGRGFSILASIASAAAVLISDGYEVTTVAHFPETSS